LRRTIEASETALRRTVLWVALANLAYFVVEFTVALTIIRVTRSVSSSSSAK
jgi:hypothetical protein